MIIFSGSTGCILWVSDFSILATKNVGWEQNLEVWTTEETRGKDLTKKRGQQKVTGTLTLYFTTLVYLFNLMDKTNWIWFTIIHSWMICQNNYEMMVYLEMFHPTLHSKFLFPPPSAPKLDYRPPLNGSFIIPKCNCSPECNKVTREWEYKCERDKLNWNFVFSPFMQRSGEEYQLTSGKQNPRNIFIFENVIIFHSWKKKRKAQS